MESCRESEWSQAEVVCSDSEMSNEWGWSGPEVSLRWLISESGMSRCCLYLNCECYIIVVVGWRCQGYLFACVWSSLSHAFGLHSHYHYRHHYHQRCIFSWSVYYLSLRRCLSFLNHWCMSIIRSHFDATIRSGSMMTELWIRSNFGSRARIIFSR